MSPARKDSSMSAASAFFSNPGKKGVDPNDENAAKHQTAAELGPALQHLANEVSAIKEVVEIIKREHYKDPPGLCKLMSL